MITLTIVQLKKLQLPAGFTDGQLNGVVHSAATEASSAIRKNFRRIMERTGSRYFWQGAADSTEVDKQTEGSTAYVVVRQKGVRLHWKGGTVRPTGKPSAVTGKPTKSLLIPFADSPLRKKGVTLAELKLPEEEMHVITSRNGCPLLVHGKRLKTRTNLTWLGKLVPQAHFDARPDVLPNAKELKSAAILGAEEAIMILKQNKR